ncbi:late competence development ComFB family protein [Paenibacillus eucommiae]|uniref:Competence protein ComFB n=1 Tax=Paenibacillus eucommiae TaxID=1355755 RepID=A0ABS4IYZ0_9BACL|nr:late competence development ComFB family protein [Paenibacillus eucommiae]MBP1992808.1 competence protein ComFB [Paenibacillus eucommiae]
MTVRNLMEEVVKQCLKDLIHNQEKLHDLDDKLQADIMAIALNSLPPKYVSSVEGEMFVKTQIRQMEPDVFRELSNAIDKVSTGRKGSFNSAEEA